jgi:hypothetical protein
LGWVENFERLSGTTGGAPRGGSPGVVLFQHRISLEARVEFDFMEWGKLQMALAGGSQHMNVLATEPNADPQPSGGAPLAAVAVLPGSTANELVLGAGVLESFKVGDVLAVDVDYQQEVGYVGSGIAAAYVRDPQDVKRDPHYTRRVTFNVGRVAAKTATSVLLTQPLIGGVPLPGAAAQRVVGFVDREGGSFFQDWSGLFVLEEESGGRLCFYYPRLSPSTAAANTANGFQRERRVEIAKPVEAISLHASLVALSHRDPNDGELVLCYRSYFPDPDASIY